MRIATWNLDHASNNSRPVPLQVAHINKIAPDILVLTETCEDVDLHVEGYRFTLATTKNCHGKHYSTIWSKFPIKKVYSTFDPETAACAEIETPIGSVIVYGTIITYHGDQGPDGMSKPWIEHYKAIESHGEDWFRILQECSQKVPLVVAGDFNQTRDNSIRTYGTKFGRDLLSNELSRCRLCCLTTEDFGATGKLTSDPTTGWTRNNIDHICVTDETFTVLDVGAWDHFTDTGKFLSDHNGVYVDLTQPAAADGQAAAP
jgi:endonuclease/exonuclease/phosphatase family metal-dependent hydrolase